MGVPGLWGLLEPARRPVELEQLSGKIVAIDMNIWLHQAVKSRAANAGPRTYLSVLFRRLCKLIYFGIRPVFVFDGAVPALKRSTMAARRKLRAQLGDKAQRAQDRLLRRLLRRVAEQSVTKPKVSPEGKKSKNGENEAKSELLRRLQQRPDVQQAMEDVELFSAPTDLSSSDGLDSNGLLRENAGLEYDDLARDYLDGFNLCELDPSGPTPELDLYSDAFCALPLQAQLRVVQLARNQLDSSVGHARSVVQLASTEPGLSTETFSNNQIARLLLRRRLAERQQQLSADLAREEAAKQVARLNNPHLTAALQSQANRLRSANQSVDGAGSDASTQMCATALRIQSHDTGHAILIKKSPLKQVPGRWSKTAPAAGTDLTLESLIQMVHRAQKEEEEGEKPIPSESPELTNAPSRTSSNLSSPHSTLETDSPSETTPAKAIYSVCVPVPEQNEDTKSADTRPTESRSNLDEEPSPCRNLFNASAEPCSNVRLQQSTPDSTKIVDDKSTETEAPTFEQAKLPEDNITSELLDVSADEVINCQTENKQTEEDQDEGEAVAIIDSNDVEEDDESDDEFVEVPSASDHPSAVADQVTVSSTTSSSSDDDGPLTTSEEHHEPDTEHATTSAENAGDWDQDDDSFVLDDDVLREEADRFARQAQNTTEKCIAEAQELLNLFGVPFLTSPEEAEAQCATLQRCGHVDLVASDDSDVWPFGARLVCRHLFGGAGDSRSDHAKQNRGTRKAREPSCYRLEDVQETLGLTVANILRLALLCGSDYTPGIQNVGPVTAVEILSEFAQSEFQSAERGQDTEWTQWLQGVEATDQLVGRVVEPLKAFVDWWNTCGSRGNQIQEAGQQLNTSPVRRKWLKLNPPPDFPDRRIVEAYLRPNVQIDLQPFMWETPRVNQLVKHASSIFGWKPDTTEAMLTAVLRRQQQRILGSAPLLGPRLITHYFNKAPAASSQLTAETVIAEKPDAVTLPSKRARNATSRLRLRATGQPAETKPTISSAVAAHADGDDALSQMPYCVRGRRTRPRVGVQHKPYETTSRGRRKKKSSSTSESDSAHRRRVLSKVALSEEDTSD